jgi:shikimate 5-dehydrogenase
MDQYLIIGDVFLLCHCGDVYAINDAIDKKQRVLKSEKKVKSIGAGGMKSAHKIMIAIFSRKVN